MITQLMVAVQTAIVRDETRYDRMLHKEVPADYRVLQRIKRHLTMLVLIWPGNGPDDVDHIRRHFM